MCVHNFGSANFLSLLTNIPHFLLFFSSRVFCESNTFLPLLCDIYSCFIFILLNLTEVGWPCCLLAMGIVSYQEDLLLHSLKDNFELYGFGQKTSISCRLSNSTLSLADCSFRFYISFIQCLLCMCVRAHEVSMCSVSLAFFFQPYLRKLCRASLASGCMKLCADERICDFCWREINRINSNEKVHTHTHSVLLH